MDRYEVERAYVVYAARVHRYFARRVFDDEIANDLTADTFMKLLQTSSYTESGKLLNFVYRAAYTVLIDWTRSGWRQHERAWTMTLHSDDPNRLLDDERTSESAERDLELVLERPWLRDVLALLTAEQRRVVLSRLGGSSYEEIAATLDTTNAAIRAIHARAMHRLRRYHDRVPAGPSSAERLSVAATLYQ